MTDPISGMSRGYGFVRFSDEGDQQRALQEMQGVYCGNRPMRISTATPKNKTGGGGPGAMGMPGPGGPGGAPVGGMNYMGNPPVGYYGQPQPMNQFTDPNNTTVFVGGLSGYVTEDELRSFFQGFGEITYVKIPPGKGCGFVQFVQRHAAEMAINQMQGYPIGNSRVRLSWGRSQNNSGPAGTPYRPAPPPPVYPSMGMPPSHPYGNFAPLKVCINTISSHNSIVLIFHSKIPPVLQAFQTICLYRAIAVISRICPSLLEMVFTRGLLLQLALTIEDYTEEFCEKSSLLMSQHVNSGMVVQQERLSGRGYDWHEIFPNPTVPTPECVAWLLLA